MSWRLAHVPDLLAWQLWCEALVESADDLEPRISGSLEACHPILGQPPARRGQPDEDRGRGVFERFLDAADYGRVAFELGRDVAHAAARERRVDDGRHLVFAVAQQTVGGLRVATREPTPRRRSRSGARALYPGSYLQCNKPAVPTATNMLSRHIWITGAGPGTRPRE